MPQEQIPQGAVRPITPDEAAKRQREEIPSEVILAFNGLIAANLRNGREATVRQNEVLARLGSLGTRDKIFKKGWLDVEEAYREAGWEVHYDSPGYGDNDFEPYFTFRRPKR